MASDDIEVAQDADGDCVWAIYYAGDPCSDAYIRVDPRDLCDLGRWR